MKNLIYFFVGICCFFLLFNKTAYAQEEGHIYAVVTWKAVMPDGGTEAERDSLMSEWVESTLKNNDKILSSKTLRHLSGSNSNDWVVITEYESWADIEAARKMNQELNKKKWPDDKKRAEFFRKLGKYFSGYSHSDEIYSELPKFKK